MTSAALASASVLGALAFAATPASASTLYYEWESEKSLGGTASTNRLQNRWSNMYIHQPTTGNELTAKLRQNTLSGSGEPLFGILWTYRAVLI